MALPGNATLEVLNPIAVFEVERVAPTPPIMDLNSKRIGLCWNRKEHGDIALQRIGDLLQNRFEALQFKFLLPTDISRPFLREQLDAIAEYKPDLIVAATGD
jgi:hypothetical protein